MTFGGFSILDGLYLVTFLGLRAGMIFESGARAVGATVLPAGTGQTELQVRSAVDIGATAYAGTPDYLKVILDAADEMGETLHITKAAVGGGALFPS